MAAVAFFHAPLDVFMTPSASLHLVSVMGALLTVGALVLVPLVGSQHLALRVRVIEPVDSYR